MRLLAIAALALLALWDETKKVDVVCPIDGTKFQAIEVVRTDADWGWGGLDGDFCRHAFKTLPMENLIWTCPACFFSGPKPAFDAKATWDKPKILGKLKPAIEIKSTMKQSDIPGHVKYDLLSQVLALSDKPATEVGTRLLHAGWAVRQMGAIWLDNFDEWTELRESMGFNKPPLDLAKQNRVEYEMKIVARMEKEAVSYKAPETQEKLLRKYCIAYTYRKHGENVKALKWLDEIAKAKDFNSFIDEACKKMRASIDLERTYQKKAAELFKKAADDATAVATTRGECMYQVAEILRRSGDSKGAAEWYTKATETTTDEKLKKIIETQKALLEP